MKWVWALALIGVTALGSQATWATAIFTKPAQVLCENFVALAPPRFNFWELKDQPEIFPSEDPHQHNLWHALGSTPLVHEIETARAYVKFLQTFWSRNFRFLLFTDVLGIKVPAVDGLIYGRGDKPYVNVSLKLGLPRLEKIEGITPMLEQMLGAALGSLHHHQFSGSTFESCGLMQSQKLSADPVVRLFDLNLEGIQSPHCRRAMEIFYRLYGLPFKQSHAKTRVVLDLRGTRLNSGHDNIHTRVTPVEVDGTTQFQLVFMSKPSANPFDLSQLHQEILHRSDYLKSVTFLFRHETIVVDRKGLRVFNMDKVRSPKKQIENPNPVPYRLADPISGDDEEPHETSPNDL